MSCPSRSLLALAIVAGLSGSLVSPSAEAAALISQDLRDRLALAPSHSVIVTFSDRSQMSRLSLLTSNLVKLNQLPMAGALLTNAQIEQVAQWNGVESIYYNAPLRYFNYEAGQITGTHAVRDDLGLTGQGVTVAVLDSGVDATHPDLKLGGNVIQNVKVLSDTGVLGVTQYLENQLNTDSSSGHGTHVAGTVGGTGEASKDDPRRPRYYAGVAPAPSSSASARAKRSRSCTHCRASTTRSRTSSATASTSSPTPGAAATASTRTIRSARPATKRIGAASW